MNEAETRAEIEELDKEAAIVLKAIKDLI